MISVVNTTVKFTLHFHLKNELVNIVIILKSFQITYTVWCPPPLPPMCSSVEMNQYIKVSSTLPIVLEI